MTQRFSQRLKAYRRLNGYKQETLARVWDYSAETISAWEREKRQPGSQEIPRIAHLLGINTNELIESIEEQHDRKKQKQPHELLAQRHLNTQNELLHVYQNRMAFGRDYSYAALFEQAHEIMAVGISLNAIAMHYPREKIVEQVVEKGCVLTLCFLNPDGFYCGVRELEEHHKEGRLRELIRLNIENIEATIATIPPEYGSQVHILTYDLPCRFNMYIFDDSFLTAQFYMYARGEDTPLYVYQRKEPNGLFEFHVSAARQILEHAKPLQVGSQGVIN